MKNGSVWAVEYLMKIFDRTPASPVVVMMHHPPYSAGLHHAEWQRDSVLRQRDWLYINPDLTVHIARPAVGEWIGMRSVTYPYGSGTGLAESAMYDATGRIARGVQSLLIDRHR